jgi:AAHS family 4-hydroxybenzoate transporter-like MFS transporter
MSIGTPAGGMVGASIVLVLLPLWGWRGTFYACGALTIALALAVLLIARESPSYLAAQGRTFDARKVARRRLGIEWEPPGAAVPAGDGADRPRVGFLNRANLRLNVGAGLGFFCIAFVSYALVAWTAIMLTSLGFAMDQALTALFAFNLAAMSAAVLAGFLMNYLGSRGTLALASVCLAATVLLLGFVLQGEPTNAAVEWGTYLLIGGSGGFAGAAMAAIYAMMAMGYQVECRSGGLGFGMMLGRTGGILAAFGGGYLLDLGGRSTWPFLAILAIAAAAGLACAFISDRHVRPRQKHSIA